MTPLLTPSIAPSRVLSLSLRRATRYPTSMPKKHDDPLYTIARYTTAQAAEMLGVGQIAVQSAIKRGTLESELVSPRIRLVSQAAIDAYRVDRLGQVGKPSRKTRRMRQKAEALKTAAATTLPSDMSVGTRDTYDADDETEA